MASVADTRLVTSAVLGPALVIVCVAMVALAAFVYRLAGLGPVWVVPGGAVRAALQLAAVCAVLAAAMERLWSSALVLAVMFIVAAVTAARRSDSDRGALWLSAPLALGLTATIPLMTFTGLVPMSGVAIVP